MSPILKWAGGKTQLLDRLVRRMPAAYETYHEPFLGGAALLFRIAPDRARVNDVNEQLVNLYTQIKNAPDSVLEKVRELDAEPCTKERYVRVRARYNEKIAGRALDAECAALMIWINKHCFNGLYRVNGRGLFNVPHNNRTAGSSVDEGNLRAVAGYLSRADIAVTCLDFEKACEAVAPGDFVYLDSPYVPESATAAFTSYTRDSFGLEDHERLARVFRRLDRLGAKVMLSNNDVPLVRSLYAGYAMEAFPARRLICRDADRRTGKELLVTNY